MEDAIALSIGGQGKYGDQTKSSGYQPKSGGFNINVVRERLVEAVRVYAQEECSIPAGMEKIHPCTDKPWSNRRHLN